MSQTVRYITVAVSIPARLSKDLSEAAQDTLAREAVSEAIHRSANHQRLGIILRQPGDPRYPTPSA